MTQQDDAGGDCIAARASVVGVAAGLPRARERPHCLLGFVLQHRLQAGHVGLGDCHLFIDAEFVDERAGVPGVAGGRQREQFLADRLWEVEVLEQLLKIVEGHVLAAGELLDALVGVSVTLAAENRLDGLAENLRRLVEFLAHHLLVRDDLLESGLEFLVGQQAVSECRAAVALDGRIREVTLEPRARDVLSQEGKIAVCLREIPLGVLEVDGVDLVWHRRRAGFARDGLLSEIAIRDVQPHVDSEVPQNVVHLAQRVEQRREVVTRVDLRRQRLVDQSEVGDELAGEGRPVDIGVGRAVGRVGSARAAEFARETLQRAVNLAERAPEARGVHRQFLAKGRRRRRLAVGAREHRNVSVLPGHRHELVPDRL